MTSNQIAYWQLQETKRANVAKEEENFRSNVANETETNRSNLAREAETYRSNAAKENETYRHNFVTEQETARHNRKNEQFDRTKLAVDTASDLYQHALPSGDTVVSTAGRVISSKGGQSLLAAAAG